MGKSQDAQAKKQISGKYQKEEQVVASQEKRTHYNEKRGPPTLFKNQTQPNPYGTHQTILIVLGHLTDKLIQLQAAGADDLDPEVVGMFRGRDIDFQELIGMETEVRTGD